MLQKNAKQTGAIAPLADPAQSWEMIGQEEQQNTSLGRSPR
jgi:hypothetical protein